MNQLIPQEVMQLLSIVGFYLDNPKALERDCPGANLWKAHVEKNLTPENSRRLSPAECAKARELGVQHPERVILCDYASVMSVLPGHPENKVIQLLNICVELPESLVQGITVGYTIGILNFKKPVPSYLAHELVHLKQFEQLDDFIAYMKKYISVFPGSDIESYAKHPMELEAFQGMFS
jgi:hypothetical protein